MESAEFETLLGELETRVDRLRSLYEQYFMGIEKTTPSIPHKDVDRRIQLLRRDQPRNTALRFRFQMIIQRYNTYQTYWQRICRQIEEGTYKRDVLRAKKKFGDGADRGSKRDVAQDAYELSDDDLLEEDLGDLLEDDDTASEWVEKTPPSKAAPTFDGPTRPIPRPGASGGFPAQPSASASGGFPAQPSASASGGFPRQSADGSGGFPRQSADGSGGFAAVPRPAALGGAPRPTWKKVDAQEAADAGRPPAAGPARAPAPAAAPAAAPRPAAATAPRPSPSGSDAGLSDDRVRRLYAEYVETRRKHNESTARVTYDDVAKTIRDGAAKLREKHGGRQVDFEVAVKDGKTILKPIVK